MKSAIIFICYHPGSLPDYDSLRKIDNNASESVLVICRHPYASDEIVEVYSQKFDHTIILPDIDYETNILKGLIRCYSFLRGFRNRMDPILKDIDRFFIFSDCSAYLPVNALISDLKRNKKCKSLISMRQDYNHEQHHNILKTARSRVYTSLLELYPVYAHMVFSYEYVTEPRDRIISLVSPYMNLYASFEQGGVPVHFICRPLVERNDSQRNTVIFYSDTNLDGAYRYSKEEFEWRLEQFFEVFASYYENCRIIFKPHPQDGGRVMCGMNHLQYELYNGRLTSQMHLDLNIRDVRACYSASSSSLLYSASLGIPSYTLYRYLEFNGEYPRAYFDNNTVRQNPFLYNLRSLAEIGIIDTLSVKTAGAAIENVWDDVLK
jgi:hypothetical protein